MSCEIHKDNTLFCSFKLLEELVKFSKTNLASSDVQRDESKLEETNGTLDRLLGTGPALESVVCPVAAKVAAEVNSWTSFLESASQSDASQAGTSCSYISVLSGTLNVLAAELNPLPSDFAHSTQNTNRIIQAVEFLVAMGLCPCLAPGAGISLERRLSSPAAKQLIGSQELPEHLSRHQLFLCTDVLLGLFDCASLRPAVCPRFLGDLLTALCHVVYQPSSGCSNCVRNQDCYSSRLDKISELVALPDLVEHCLIISGVSGKAPAWFRHGIGDLLSRSLVERDGLLTLLQTMSRFTGSSTRIRDDWKLRRSLAGIISRCPKRFSSAPSQYYSIICAQLWTLIAADASHSNYLPFLVELCDELVRNGAASCVEDSVLQPLFSSWEHCLALSPDPDLWPSSEVLGQSLLTLRRLLPLSSESRPSVVGKRLFSVLDVLFVCYSDLVHSVSTFRDALQELIVDSVTGRSVAQTVVHLASGRPAHSSVSVAKAGVTFHNTISGPSMTRTFDLAETETERRLQRVQGALKLVVVLMPTRPSLVSDLIAGTIHELYQLMGHPLPKTHPDSQFVLLQDEIKHEALECIGVQFKFLESLLEDYEEAILSDSCGMIKIALDALRCFPTPGMILSEEDSSSDRLLSVLLGILSTAAFCYVSNLESLRPLFMEALDVLKALARLKLGADVKEQIVSLQELLKSVLGEGWSSADSTASSGQLSEVEKDLESPEVAVRGHALIFLARLIRNKDVDAATSVAFLPKVMNTLDEEDSYVYLAAVNALAALGSVAPSAVVPELMTKFADPSLTPEPRVRIGEVVVKCLRELNELVPMYAEELLGRLLCLCRDADAGIRASAISVTAELCSLLSFKLGKYLQELLYCAEQTLKWDTCSLVRRASVHLLRGIIQGVGADLAQGLGDSAESLLVCLLDATRDDRDLILRVHAQLCLDDLKQRLLLQ